MALLPVPPLEILAPHGGILVNRAAGRGEDPLKLRRIAKRVQEAIAAAVHAEPLRIDPRAIGVSPLNRLFSIQQVHNTLLASIVKDGHDPTRPQVGICVEIRDPAALKSLVNFNASMARTSPLMSKVHPELLRYECLSSTHYNVALRLGREANYSPAGDLAKAKEEDTSFADSCAHGHKWIVLPESLDAKLKQDVSTWRNQDQHENQTITDGELLRMAKVTVDDYLVKARSAIGPTSLPLTQIVAATCLRSPLKLNGSVVGSFCRYVCQMAEEKHAHLVTEFLVFWSATVDPRALALPHTYLDAIAKSPDLKGHPHLRLWLLIVMYTQEGAQLKTKPTPDQCGLVSLTDLGLLAKQPFVVTLVEAWLKKLHTEFRAHLDKHLAEHEARDEICSAGVLLVRMALGKKMMCEATASWGALSTCKWQSNNRESPEAPGLVGEAPGREA